MKLLVKIGGTLLDEVSSRTRLARELAALKDDGHAVVIVHGGGKQMTRFLGERGIESRFIDGLRVTGPEVVDAVLKVFAGSVNHTLVSSLVEAGAMAVGLSGIDALLAEAEQLSPELGAVGRVIRSNPAVLEVLIAGGFLPVVACVAGDRNGGVFNVNADQMAVACAIGFKAEYLIFLTDVEGVRNAEGTVIPLMRPDECVHLINSGVATGGMQAKLNAAIEAVEGGAGQVVIAPGSLDRVAARIVAGEEIGTRLASLSSLEATHA
ncbi:MAG: acetylglutamate kinase [Bryobacteraceae bacterium]|nr:acetylglutamate kinase [Bryobacteraceae bacterium]